MRHHAYVLAAGFMLLTASASRAQSTGETICKDKTTSTAVGKGACSGHGGVDAQATAAAKKSTKKVTKAADKEVKTADKAATKEAKTADKAATKETKTADKAATKGAKTAEKVTCTDGTTSKGGRGACSGHGGIKKP